MNDELQTEEREEKNELEISEEGMKEIVTSTPDSESKKEKKANKSSTIAFILLAIMIPILMMAFVVIKDVLSNPIPVGTAFDSQEDMIKAAAGVYEWSEGHYTVIKTNGTVTEYERLFDIDNDWDNLRESMKGTNFTAMTFDSYLEDGPHVEVKQQYLTFDPAKGRLYHGEKLAYTIENDGGYRLCSINDFDGKLQIWSRSKRISKKTDIIALFAEKFDTFKKEMKAIVETSTAKGPGRCEAPDDRIVSCAQQIYEKILKNPSSAIYNNAYVAEKDEYQRVIVYLDVSSQNSFGGYVRDQIYVCLQYVDRRGQEFQYYPTTFYASSLQLLEKANNWGKM